MLISILTLFPEMFTGPFDASIIKRAQEKKLVDIEYINIRDFGIGPHKMVDDTPYGGGVGMIMRVDVLHDAIRHTTREDLPNRKIVLLSAKGKMYKQQTARSYAKLDHLILICGHYEGVDERIMQFIDEEISIGEYVLTGGEIPAMVITDSVSRLIDGVLKPDATAFESYSLIDDISKQPLLEYPQYTRPDVYEKLEVPDVLRSGNHKNIQEWRMKRAEENSKQNNSS